jgi:hypothetical protein
MIIDADVAIDILRRRPEAKAWFTGLSDRPNLSGAAAWEVIFGARSAVELRQVRTFLALFPIIWPTEADARAVAELAEYRLSDGIDILDSLTAVIARRTGEPIATFNVKHFRAIPGLTTIQPYERS